VTECSKQLSDHSEETDLMSSRRIVIDLELCEGHARCAETVPEVFEVREEDDKSHLLHDEISEQLVPKVENAILLCPRGALSWATD
jgi:ferredoxin